MAINYTGRTYGFLTVLSELPTIFKINSNGVKSWIKKLECKCVCGNTVSVIAKNLSNGNTSSCGCYKSVLTGDRNRSHGLSRSSEYDIWCSMKSRCHRKADRSYKWYGGKGIKVCNRWMHSFENFLKDMGVRPSKKHTIERKKSNLNYCPSNCTWETQKEQVRNRDVVIKVIYNGKKRRLIEVCEELGLSPSVIRNRIRVGWELNDALAAPKYARRKSKLAK